MSRAVDPTLIAFCDAMAALLVADHLKGKGRPDGQERRAGGDTPLLPRKRPYARPKRRGPSK